MGKDPDRLGELYQLAASQPAARGVPPEGQFLLESGTSEGLHPYQGHRFWILDARGNVVAEFAPDFQSDCEYGLPVVYEMRDGTLFKYSGRSNDALADSLCRWEAEIVCVAHRRLDWNDPRARAILQAMG